MIPVGFGPSFPVRAATPKQGRAHSSLSSQLAQHAGQDRFSGKKNDEVPKHIPAEKVEETRERIADIEKKGDSPKKVSVVTTLLGYTAALAGAPQVGLPLVLAGGAVDINAASEKEELKGLKKALDKKIE